MREDTGGVQPGMAEDHQQLQVSNLVAQTFKDRGLTFTQCEDP